MKRSYKILLGNIGVAIVFTIIITLAGNERIIASDVGVIFGLTCLGLALLNLFVGFIMVLMPDQRATGQTLLISGAVLLLLSGISCGTAISGMRF